MDLGDSYSKEEIERLRSEMQPIIEEMQESEKAFLANKRDGDFYSLLNQYVEAIKSGNTLEMHYIEFIMSGMVPRWIPISKQIPDEGIEVLIFVKTKHAEYCEVAEWNIHRFVTEQGVEYDNEEAKFWMPLPNHPITINN